MVERRLNRYATRNPSKNGSENEKRFIKIKSYIRINYLQNKNDIQIILP